MAEILCINYVLTILLVENIHAGILPTIALSYTAIWPSNFAYKMRNYTNKI